MGAAESSRRSGTGTPQETLTGRQELERRIAALKERMQKLTHPCDRGEVAHLINHYRKKLEALPTCHSEERSDEESDYTLAN